MVQADLVLEGGGVKGIALVGAISALVEAGYSFPRVAGSSSGAIVGALVAAGMPVEQMEAELRALDYQRFRDGNLLDHLGPVGQGLSILLDEGVYKGRELERWLGGLLRPLGVRTFADLRVRDSDASMGPGRDDFKLVVTTTDVSQGRLARLPWDYREFYGLDPDDQPVVRAVHASSAIPVFYRPVRLGQSWLLDGGLLSDFPITAFDRADGQPPRWPTFGIKLSTASPQTGSRVIHPISGPLTLARATIETLVSSSDTMHLEEPSVRARTIFVHTAGVSSTDFDIDAATRERLFQAGRTAAQAFLATWDFEAYLAGSR